MSENPSSSEPAVEETASAEPMDAAQTESISAPKKGDKKKMWVVIVAIVVVAALIGTAAYFLVFAEKKLGVTMLPDDDPLEVGAGGSLDLSVEVKYDGAVKTATDGVEYAWSVSPPDLGEFDRVARASVEFTAGVDAGDGAIECSVTYEGKTTVIEREIVVGPPFLETVNILPSSKELEIDQEWEFVATAYNSVGVEVTGATFDWTVTGLAAGEYTLSSTTNPNVTFSASVIGNATLTVEAEKNGETASGTATVEIVAEVAVRSIDYYWYDMFAHPLGDWYDDREQYYGDEYKLTDSYPYLYIWEGAPPGNVWIYTFMRMDMEGLNMPELNMNDNPEFLPFFGTARGGNAIVDWYMDYLTWEESQAKLGAGAIAWHDGWLIELVGNVTLDRQAAKAVLGVTDAEFDDFDNWWADNGASVKGDWEVWMNNEASNDRLAIFACYEYDLTFVTFEMDAQKVGEEVVVFMDTISWGIEALMLRWMAEAWMPTEWYMEDANFYMEIGPERADVSIDAAVGYAMYCYETTMEADPCWAWEALMQDYVESSPEYPISMFDPYADFTYLNYAPGSDWYGEEMPWDYTPGAFDLLEGETLTLEWPDDEVLFFVHSPGSDGVIEDIGVKPMADTTNVKDFMTCVYAEPMESDAPDNFEIDLASRTVTYTGPFDMWNWSNTQTAHQWLLDEWDRLGILPYGAPYVEFRPASTISLDLKVEDIRSPLEIGESSSFNVTIVNELTGEPFVDYAGTITFESSDTAAVLPADYTFVPGTDMGTHEFAVVFNTVDPVIHQSSHYVTVTDVADATLTGTQSGVIVQESPRIASFDVAFSGADVIATEPTEVTVTAYNQWDEVFTGYEGTVNFTSDDAGALLPPDTAFTAGMNGVQDFSITFSAPGLQNVNVSDVAVPEAYGEASATVLNMPVADHFLLTGVSDPAVYQTDETMTVTVYDQYDREFLAYEGTVAFETNRTGDVLLPPDTTFTLGDSSVDVLINFTVEGYYTVWCNDTSAPSITGSLSVWVVPGLPVISYFTVTGIESMWENNYSSVTVTAYDQYDSVFEDYLGEVAFDTNAVGTYELPADYQFLAGDNGVHTFPDSVMFDEPGTFNVTVMDKADPTVNGSQEDIVIVDLVADSMEILGPAVVMENATFSVTVSVYHQYGEVFEEYGGTVTFSSSDTSGYEVLPAAYDFLPADEGTHEFEDELSLSELGPLTVTVSDGTLSAVLDVEVIPYVSSSLTYKVYDMFGEPWHPFWDYRVASSTWDTERLLTPDAGDVTYLYSTDPNPKGNNDVGLIYAPYRWNIDATSIPNMNVHAPMLMPVLGSGPVAGAEATVSVYAQYIYPGAGSWWEEYWIPTWGGASDWVGDTYAGLTDGYYMGTVYTVTMNREAAEEWLGMPTGDDPATWWTANGASYEADWEDWVDDQGNEIFDIWNAYEWPYVDLGTFTSLTGDSTQVELNLAHISWGWEILLTRWLNYTQVSPHQPYWEDIDVLVDYSETVCDFYMDAVCQWSMHAVKANASANVDGAPCAWVWEPLGADYRESQSAHPVSQFDDYAVREYTSWNCGDPAYSTEVTYEGTPWAFSLPAYGTLIVELPTGTDLPGYYGETVSEDAIKNVWGGDTSDYTALLHSGEMSLGYHVTNDCPGLSYDDVGKVLTITGPFDFDNPRGDGTLYHGAPWLEFNVTEVTKAQAVSIGPAESVPSAGGIVSEEPAVAATISASSEIVSLVGVLCAVMLVIAALAAGVGRRRELC